MLRMGVVVPPRPRADVTAIVVPGFFQSVETLTSPPASSIIAPPLKVLVESMPAKEGAWTEIAYCCVGVVGILLKVQLLMVKSESALPSSMPFSRARRG